MNFSRFLNIAVVICAFLIGRGVFNVQSMQPNPSEFCEKLLNATKETGASWYLAEELANLARIRSANAEACPDLPPYSSVEEIALSAVGKSPSDPNVLQSAGLALFNVKSPKALRIWKTSLEILSNQKKELPDALVVTVLRRISNPENLADLLPPLMPVLSQWRGEAIRNFGIKAEQTFNKLYNETINTLEQGQVDDENLEYLQVLADTVEDEAVRKRTDALLGKTFAARRQEREAKYFFQRSQLSKCAVMHGQNPDDLSPDMNPLSWWEKPAIKFRGQQFSVGAYIPISCAPARLEFRADKLLAVPLRSIRILDSNDNYDFKERSLKKSNEVKIGEITYLSLDADSIRRYVKLLFPRSVERRGELRNINMNLSVYAN